MSRGIPPRAGRARRAAPMTTGNKNQIRATKTKTRCIEEKSLYEMAMRRHSAGVTVKYGRKKSAIEMRLQFKGRETLHAISSLLQTMSQLLFLVRYIPKL